MTRELSINRVDGRRGLSTLTYYIETAHAVVQYAIAVLLLVFAAATDLWTGAIAAWSVFYLPPVAMLAWHRSWAAARTFAVVAGIVTFMVDVVSHGGYAPPGLMYWNAAVNTGIFLFVGRILAELRAALREEHEMARTDDLTGVANNRSFLEFATLELARQRRYYHPLSLAFLDCDNFKRVNDFYGHAKGDELLRRIALVITQTLREVDVVARLGGDEFAILLPESDQKAAAHVIRKLRNSLKPIGDQYGVTFSMGIVTYLQPAESVDQMLKAADKVMYEVKRAGKNGARHRTYGRFTDEDDGQGVLPGL
ncbi:MAG TPA: GGDEF domain-containing protein [Longimicrobiales bacterium]|nr:GGDEF domain-containing protein [Longimicrobiales bacterium]